MAYPVSSIPTLSSLAPPLDYFEAHLRQHVISQIFLNVSGDKDSSLRKGKKKSTTPLIIETCEAKYLLLISSLHPAQASPMLWFKIPSASISRARELRELVGAECAAD